MPLTTAEANAWLNASTLEATYPFTTGPLKIGLVTVAGSAGAAGTEVSGGSGPYSRQAITFGAGAASGSISNTVAVTFSGMPACTVVGFELWGDSAGTPNRKWYGPLASSKTLQAGDSFNLPIGSVVLTAA